MKLLFTKMTNNIIKYHYLMIFILLIISSCKKDEIKPVQEYNEDKGVFICNEGNFTYGNGSLSFYNTTSGGVNNQIFYNANNFPLGDVVQSMSIFNNKGYVVVNNSGKIMVININDFKHIATISGLSSPRYILFVNNEKAYVSDLYSPNITIINPSTYAIVGNINVGSGSEQMAMINGFVYVTSWSHNNKVYKINSNTNVLTDSIVVGKQPNSIVADKYNNIWVLSDGGYQGTPYGQDTATLICINTSTFTIQKRLLFPSMDTSPTKLCINQSKDTVFYINGSWGGNQGNQSGVYKMSVDATALPASPIIPEGIRLFYGLGISPYDSKIYVSDAIDYVQKGLVFRYTTNGEKIDSFKVDITPSSFCFK